MSETYPKHNIKNGTTLDPERVNDNYRELISEINGNLDERNVVRNGIHSNAFREGSLARTTKFQETGRLNCSKHPPTASRTATYSKNLPRTANTATRPIEGWPGNTVIPYSGDWVTLGKIEVVTRECLIWLLGSLQQTYYMHPDAREEVGEEASASKEESIFATSFVKTGKRDRYRFVPGVQYALSIDGGRVAETTIGGFDIAEDDHGAAYSQYTSPFVTDLVLPITAGKHVFKLEARVPRSTRTWPQFSQEHSGYVVTSRELILLELT